MAVENKKIRQRTATAAEWASVNPVLLSGEVGWEGDTTNSKLGDGVTPWNSLAYRQTILTDVVTGKRYKLLVVNGILNTEEM
jgi:hypothetical protein